MAQVIAKDICPSCGSDREQLRHWLKERDVLQPMISKKYGYDFVWQRSDNHQHALTLINKCPTCQQAMGIKEAQLGSI